MRIRTDTQEYYRNLVKEVLILRNYISCLHPINQSSLISYILTVEKNLLCYIMTF